MNTNPINHTKHLHECHSCVNLSKQLKVIKADHDYHIKRTQQDLAYMKVTHDMKFNKEMQKLKQELKKLKLQKEKQITTWMGKYDEVIKRTENQINQYCMKKDKETEDLLKNMEKEKNKQLQQFKSTSITFYQQKIQKLTQQNYTQINSLIDKHQTQMQNLKKTYELMINQINIKNQQEMKRKISYYESFIVGIQSQRNVQVNLHRKTKEKAELQQHKLMEQIVILKRNIAEHEQKILTLKKQIKEKSMRVQDLQNQMIEKQSLFNQKYQLLSSQYQKKHQNQQNKTEQKLQKILEKQLQSCSKYQNALKNIQKQRNIENKMYQANLQEIKTCVEDRPSRNQDIEEIRKLKQMLEKRQRQLYSLNNNLKKYQRELQNKQQNWDMIFGPGVKTKEINPKRPIGKSMNALRDPLRDNTNNINSVKIGSLIPLNNSIIQKKQNKLVPYLKSNQLRQLR